MLIEVLNQTKETLYHLVQSFVWWNVSKKDLYLKRVRKHFYTTYTVPSNIMHQIISETEETVSHRAVIKKKSYEVETGADFFQA